MTYTIMASLTWLDEDHDEHTETETKRVNARSMVEALVHARQLVEDLESSSQPMSVFSIQIKDC